MTDEKKIEELLTSFYNGNTTPEEEQFLTAFFNSHEVSDKYQVDSDIFKSLLDTERIPIPEGMAERLEHALDEYMGNQSRHAELVSASLHPYQGITEQVCNDERVTSFKETSAALSMASNKKHPPAPFKGGTLNIPLPPFLPFGKRQIDRFSKERSKGELSERRRKLYLTLASAAAVALLCIGLFFANGRQSKTDYFTDTFTNPQDAAIAAEQALLLVASKLNKGLAPYEKFRENLNNTNKILNDNLTIN